MADDGGWLKDAGVAPAETREEAGRLARQQFRAALTEFGERLASPQPLRRETAIDLVHQLERLGRRMVSDHAATHGRVGELDAALSALSARLEVETAAHATRETELQTRLDQALRELAALRTAKAPKPESRAGRAILPAAGLCVGLAGAVGGMAVLRPGPAPPPQPAPQEAGGESTPTTVATPAEEPTAPTPGASKPLPSVTSGLKPSRDYVVTAKRQADARPRRASGPVSEPAARSRLTEAEVLAAAAPPTPTDGIVAAAAPGPEGASVADAQVFLSRLGYYVGPIDGVETPALKAAASAYMNDRPIKTRGDN